MKLRNKKTGEIVSLEGEFLFDNKVMLLKQYDSLAELNEEWEDYEEPETFWYMTAWGDVKEYSQDQFAIKQKQAIGNYFETKEEAEKAVEKLKAWKRLKDKGFRFKGWNCALQELYFDVHDTFYDRPDMVGEAISEETTKDLDLLFGGEK